MGANIETTVTATLVSLGQMRNLGELQCGFATASLHGMFNFITVAILFPLERAMSFLAELTGILVEGANKGSCQETY